MSVAIEIRTEAATREAIVGRIERRDITHNVVPEYVINTIDRVMESLSDAKSYNEDDRYARIHEVYTEFLEQISADTDVEEATQLFDEYMACLIRNAKTTHYRVGVDSSGAVICEAAA